MLKILCYVADKDAFEYIAASESGRLATRIQNPFAQIPEIKDLERLLKENLEVIDGPKPDGWSEILDSVHQYNETVSPYERVRYIKTLTPQLSQAITMARAQCDARYSILSQQNQKTILNMELKVVKVEKDGE